jgi:hypothetical protein
MCKSIDNPILRAFRIALLGQLFGGAGQEWNDANGVSTAFLASLPGAGRVAAQRLKAVKKYLVRDEVEHREVEDVSRSCVHMKGSQRAQQCRDLQRTPVSVMRETTELVTWLFMKEESEQHQISGSFRRKIFG